MSNPWMKFYPSDWRADPTLRMCSLGARGLWIELLSLMHEAEPYGHLLISGKSISETQIAVLSGSDLKTIKFTLSELREAGVFSVTDSGVIYSRRMVRDSAKAKIDKENGKYGGNPHLKPYVNGGVNRQDKAQKPEARSHKPLARIHEPIAKSQQPEAVSQEPPKAKESRKAAPRAPAQSSESWEAYAVAFHQRYGARPVRNAKVNGQMALFVGRLGIEESPFVAAFFVTHNNGYYVQRGHSVDCLLSDAEKLRMEWATNRKTTQTQARQTDQTASNPFLKMLEDKKRDGAISGK